MNEWNKDGDAALDTELARLRDALHEVHSAESSEESLRMAWSTKARTSSRFASLKQGMTTTHSAIFCAAFYEPAGK